MRMDELHLAYSFYDYDARGDVAAGGLVGEPQGQAADASNGAGDDLTGSRTPVSRIPITRKNLYLLRGLAIEAGEPGLVCGHHLYSDGQGFVYLVAVMDWFSVGCWRAGVDQHGHEILRRSVAGGAGTARTTGHLQHRPRGSVHQSTTFWLNCRHAGLGQHGWQRSVWTTSSSSGCGGA